MSASVLVIDWGPVKAGLFIGCCDGEIVGGVVFFVSAFG